MASSMKLAGGGSVIAGEIKSWPTSTPPPGYLLCDGSAVSQTTYAALYAVIGYTYGNPGGGNFNLPDLRERIPVGYKSGSSEFGTLGGTGGAKTHTLSTGEMPSHTHGIASCTGGGSAGTAVWPVYQNQSTMTSTSAGSGSAHNNIQPYITLNYIIKT